MSSSGFSYDNESLLDLSVSKPDIWLLRRKGSWIYLILENVYFLCFWISILDLRLSVERRMGSYLYRSLSIVSGSSLEFTRFYSVFTKVVVTNVSSTLQSLPYLNVDLPKSFDYIILEFLILFSLCIFVLLVGLLPGLKSVMWSLFLPQHYLFPIIKKSIYSKNYKLK